jgi:hypothetical protein
MLNKEYYYNASIEDVFYLEGIDKDMDIRDFDRWLNSKHAILDDSERRYLRCVVLPFYDKVTCVTKLKYNTNEYYIKICVKSESTNLVYESITLPIFISNMYAGMERGKQYSLKELGIFK